MKYLLAAIAVFAAVIGLAAALFESASRHDRDNFAAARNACERGCIQDSGGLDQCRQFCKTHPDHYP
ncbi:MAG TPA: hypothetical protein VFA75_08195 [Nevskia sp.]|nr:hypothetical protein [Nevskia sp.]